ncbi:MAG: MFS transporter [Thermoleophilia bacterium]
MSHAAPPDQHLPSKRRMWLTLFAMCFALFMIMLDNTVVNVALPTIQKDLHPSQSGLQWIINAYILVFAALILLGGKLGDRFGRKRMFIVGLVLFTVFSVACALSQTAEQLIIFRALQGTGAALMNPLSLSILVATFPRPKLPQAIGIWAGVSGLGLALGPLLGGFLTEHVGWSAVFWINVPIGVIALGFVLFVVSESKDSTVKSLDVVGTILVTLGLFGLIYALIGTSTHQWLSANTLVPLIVGIVLIIVFIIWESKHDEPMVPLGFFRSRGFTTSIIVATLVGFGLYGSLFVVTLYMQNIRGYSAVEAGLRTLPLTMAVMFVAPIAGKLNARLGPALLMGTGLALSSIAMIGLRFLEVDSSYNLIWPFYLMLGTGIALTLPAASAAAMGAIDPRKAGVGSGVLNASRQVGGALGIAVLGSVATALTDKAWTEKTDAMGGQIAANADKLRPLVQGAQIQVLGEIVSERVSGAADMMMAMAASAWMDGFHASVLAGAIILGAGVVVVIVGFRGVPRPSMGHGADSSDSAPPVVAEL